MLPRPGLAFAVSREMPPALRPPPRLGQRIPVVAAPFSAWEAFDVRAARIPRLQRKQAKGTRLTKSLGGFNDTLHVGRSVRHTTHHKCARTVTTPWGGWGAEVIWVLGQVPPASCLRVYSQVTQSTPGCKTPRGQPQMLKNNCLHQLVGSHLD